MSFCFWATAVVLVARRICERFSDLHVSISDVWMAAPPRCRSAQNDVCHQLQPCTSAQTRPRTLTPTPFEGLEVCNPATYRYVMDFTWTSEQPGKHARFYLFPFVRVVIHININRKIVRVCVCVCLSCYLILRKYIYITVTVRAYLLWAGTPGLF